jgi:hypothetical protein
LLYFAALYFEALSDVVPSSAERRPSTAAFRQRTAEHQFIAWNPPTVRRLKKEYLRRWRDSAETQSQHALDTIDEHCRYRDLLYLNGVHFALRTRIATRSVLETFEVCCHDTLGELRKRMIYHSALTREFLAKVLDLAMENFDAHGRVSDSFYALLRVFGALCDKNGLLLIAQFRHCREVGVLRIDEFRNASIAYVQPMRSDWSRAAIFQIKQRCSRSNSISLSLAQNVPLPALAS